MISTILFFALAFVFAMLIMQKEETGVFSFCEKEIEHFGEKYRVVRIGDRCWMAQNLRATKYLDGSEILRIEEDVEWESADEGAYTVYPNVDLFVIDESFEGGCGIADEEEEVEIPRVFMEEPEVVRLFGYLYNFYAVNSPFGLCPEGWSVPSHQDWVDLERALCSSDSCTEDFSSNQEAVGYRGTNEGSKLAGFFHLWYDGDLKEDPSFDVSSFDALPGGYRDTLGPFSGQGLSSFFWSSADSDGGVWVREVHSNRTDITRNYFQGFFGGLSVRCIKDR